MPDPKLVQGIQFKNQLWDNIGYKAILELCSGVGLSFVIFCMGWKYISSSLFWPKFALNLGFQMEPCLGYGISGGDNTSHQVFGSSRGIIFFNKSNLGLLRDKVSSFRLFLDKILFSNQISYFLLNINYDRLLYFSIIERNSFKYDVLSPWPSAILHWAFVPVLGLPELHKLLQTTISVLIIKLRLAV